MKSLYCLTFVTLFLTTSLTSWGAVDSPSPDFQDQPEDSAVLADDPLKIKTIDIAPVPETDLKKFDQSMLDYFYPYHRSLSPRLGFAYDTKHYGENQDLLYSIGFQYMFLWQSARHIEVGADILSDGTGAIHLQEKWEMSRSRIRPYFKAGGGIRITPREGIASLLKLENIQIRGAFGYEHLLAPPLSLRLELEGTIRMSSLQGLVYIGYVWGF